MQGLGCTDASVYFYVTIQWCDAVKFQAEDFRGLVKAAWCPALLSEVVITPRHRAADSTAGTCPVEQGQTAGASLEPIRALSVCC